MIKKKIGTLEFIDSEFHDIDSLIDALKEARKEGAEKVWFTHGDHEYIELGKWFAIHAYKEIKIEDV